MSPCLTLIWGQQFGVTTETKHLESACDSTAAGCAAAAPPAEGASDRSGRVMDGFSGVGHVSSGARMAAEKEPGNKHGVTQRRFTSSSPLQESVEETISYWCSELKPSGSEGLGPGSRVQGPGSRFRPVHLIIC
ncbi:unnamed protein product [Pleuronectes platessa]|uniref:Uncharacterized protein n=1 Tax=Pleuronectes platessa TaxID=8262 RepID=A0A9N7UL43_PLEPL|nr:unnamed protein product [Pleuronectes platessa]